MQFRLSLKRVTEQLEAISALSEEVRRAQTLPPVMQAILSVGNVMNAGTAKGAASGFRLASLEALTRTRSGNGKTTLLHYLCKVRRAAWSRRVDPRLSPEGRTRPSLPPPSAVARCPAMPLTSLPLSPRRDPPNLRGPRALPLLPAPQLLDAKMPRLLLWPDQLPHLEAASRIDLTELQEEAAQLIQGLEVVTMEVGACEMDAKKGVSPDLFSPRAKPFVAEARAALEQMQKQREGAVQHAQRAVAYFGEDPAKTSFNDMCVALCNFKNVFKQAVKDNQSEKEREEKARRKLEERMAREQERREGGGPAGADAARAGGCVAGETSARSCLPAVPLTHSRTVPRTPELSAWRARARSSRRGGVEWQDDLQKAMARRRAGIENSGAAPSPPSSPYRTRPQGLVPPPRPKGAEGDALGRNSQAAGARSIAQSAHAVHSIPSGHV